MASPQQPAALVEGRRIYLGNLLYVVRPVEIEDMLNDNGFGAFEKIHISIDPVSSRNPGYCFVDFSERADAARALSDLEVKIRDRPVKVGPCEPKKPRERGWRSEPAPADKRWGNWTGQKDGRAGRIERGPYGAMNHFDESVVTDGDGRRIRIGGLTRMIDQQHNQDEIRELLAGFNPVAVGKRITPSEEVRQKHGNHHFCFVDFGTREEASAVIKALNGRPHDGGQLLVDVAKPIPEGLRGPTRWSKDENPEKKDNSRWRERPARQDDWSRPSRLNPSRPRISSDNGTEEARSFKSKTLTTDQRSSWAGTDSNQKPSPDRSSWRRFGSGASDLSATSKSDQKPRSFVSSNWRQG